MPGFFFLRFFLHSFSFRYILGGNGAASAGPSAAAVVAPRNEEDPAWIRQMLAANPDQLALLKQNNPRLAEAYQSGSLEEFAKVVRKIRDLIPWYRYRVTPCTGTGTGSSSKRSNPDQGCIRKVLVGF
jgi:hypothetical protein